jgi:putative FmdB family regulatory protein
MPIYEYRCQDCGNRFEILQRLGQGAEGVSCPECGEERVEKQYSTFASGTASNTGDSGRSDAAPLRGCGPGCGCVH